MIQQRNIAVSLILTVLTCGIYGIYWFVVLTDDVKAASEDNQLSSGGVAILLTIVTCGIYSIYWAYMMGKDIQKAKSKNNVTASDNSILYLILQIAGFGIINYCLIQSELNSIAQPVDEKA